ncbi:MAG: exodeoxyribonuclease VII large subunit [Cellulosilyticum sp.]|nr:exodeoxyribonuclease VII large subunit [Cellulosilyticum sp.]
MKRKIVSVWEVNQYVSRLIEEDYTLSDLWLQGEVSNCKYHHSGHVYFTIKDARASLQSVMFERDARRLSFRLEEGMKIYARVRITIYEKTGAYQAYVFDIEKQGKGLLYERFERLKAQLAQEGLFDEDLKKPIPRFPKNVGIITSQTGAAVRDIIQVARRRNPGIPLTIYPTHVQGEYAVAEIVEALRVANEEKRVDVIILGRGGGSIEDLWAFNEEAVARAIAASHIPVVSAVGHEVDFTISDFVSDKRAATPSAAAELVVPSQEEWMEMVLNYKHTLSIRMEAKTGAARRQLEYLMSRPVFAKKDLFYKTKMQTIDDYSYKLSHAYERLLGVHQKRYEIAVHNLERLSPLSTLKRGYSLVSKEEYLVKSVKEVTPGDIVEITVTDGQFKAKVCMKE